MRMSISWIVFTTVSRVSFPRTPIASNCSKRCYRIFSCRWDCGIISSILSNKSIIQKRQHMMKHIRLLSTIAAVLVLSAPVFAQRDQNVSRQKLINKSYDVTGDDKLSIDNQFGNVVVSTWDKPQITVDIEVSARAASDE